MYTYTLYSITAALMRHPPPTHTHNSTVAESDVH